MPGFLPPLAAFRSLAQATRCSRATPIIARAPSPLRSLSTSALAFQRAGLRPTLPSGKAAPPVAGSFFGKSYLPYSARGSFFTPSRYLSTASTGVGATAAGTGSADDATAGVRTIPRSLPIWLLGCSALVFGIIVIGGLTRLTESGLSIVEWNPITGIRPPITDAEWDEEWEKYRVSPEGIL